MVKLIKPKSFFLKGGTKAVLLLHSFTNNPRDMRQLGRYLNGKGYTCFAPIYKGHGLSPEQLIQTTPTDWWKSVEEGYHFLKNKGYKHIAVIGVSLGGVFALNVGKRFNDVNGIVIMSVPYKREVDSLKGRILKFARAYKQFEGKEEQQICIEIKKLEKLSSERLVFLKNHIDMTMQDLEINKPIRIMYGELDEPLYKESANYIYDNLITSNKSVKGYLNSKHLMSLGKDQEIIHSDILSFLKNLQW
ncbi:alpha/beta hydrolase [Bacillus atrophaeus]|uniref:alpha/beta hydrolase n=2 Tax=Bacillus atrophaeus TaxID=1452 RepID=UPI00227E2D86|nr:alpha/beta fold hydrolase [Bacillus atrophaeus]MCY8519582.1 alpha/beta fold hydrolase [Bacillus atrophaeus]MCY8991292.1 alpha/beta fold hydrolase [Bacillus atrophaeus]MCY9111884.1 alpha/beta fold hydrolase [Bacillus atrophaeus]